MGSIFCKEGATIYKYADWSANDRVDIILSNPPFGGGEDGTEIFLMFRTKETADLFLN